MARWLCFAACGWLFVADAAQAARPLPPSEKVQAAKRLVAETFAKELSQADKAPAVKAMLELADKTSGDAPSQAALYLSAAEVAARIGDTRLAFDAVDQLARVFDVDVLATKGSLLDLAAEHAKANDARLSVTNRGMELAEAAIAAGKFDLADAALKTAASATAKLRDANLRKEVAAKRRELEKARKQASRIESEIAEARKKLDANPNDSAANESLGKHLAFDRSDWTAGLKHLAKAKDSQLRAVAAADRAAGDDSAQMAQAGDLWWSLAESSSDARDKAGYRSRAVFWYTRAAAGLSGLAKARLEKRIAEAGEAALAAAAGQSGGESDKYLDITLAPGVVMRLVKIPASKDGKVKEFYLGQTEVTQKQWQAVMGENPSTYKGDDLPVGNLSIDDCRTFIKALDAGSYAKRLKFRLVAKSEWEYAYLAGNKSDSYAKIFDEIAWVAPHSEGKPHSVRGKKPNAFGLYDTIGNNWEIVEGPLIVGGSFWQTISDCQKGLIADGLETDPKKSGYKNLSFGFRVAADSR